MKWAATTSSDVTLTRMTAFSKCVRIGFAADIPELLAGFALLATLACANAAPSRALPAAFEPGKRVLLDAHNAYPERGRFADRLSRALATGMPLAIEQDLYWRRDSVTGMYESVVAHDADALAGAPTLESHFFDAVRPLMERALAENRRASWPLVTLNLDFKTNERAHHDAIWTLLGKYSAWLTTAPRTAAGERAALSIGPMLVLTGADSGQRRRFHDEVPTGERLRLFGALPLPAPSGATREQRARDQVQVPPGALIAERASNYVRWVNLAWLAVEEGGATLAGEWTRADRERLGALVHAAHEQGYWIRFYTLDGFRPEENAGFTSSYNFGDAGRATLRWQAAIDAGVDFVATDQYEAFARLLRERPRAR